MTDQKGQTRKIKIKGPESRIEIFETDLPGDRVEREKPTKIKISKDDLAPERIEVRVEDLGEKTGKIALTEADFDESGEGKLGDAEMEAKEKFVAFIDAHLLEETDNEGGRDSRYSFDAEGQLIPVETVEFYDSLTIHPEQPDSTMRTKGVYIIGENGSNFEVCYDDARGFGSVVSGQHQEIDPKQALMTIDIIDAAEKQGGLTHVEGYGFSS